MDESNPLTSLLTPTSRRSWSRIFSRRPY